MPKRNVNGPPWREKNWDVGVQCERSPLTAWWRMYFCEWLNFDEFSIDGRLKSTSFFVLRHLLLSLLAPRAVGFNSWKHVWINNHFPLKNDFIPGGSPCIQEAPGKVLHGRIPRKTPYMGLIRWNGVPVNFLQKGTIKSYGSWTTGQTEPK